MMLSLLGDLQVPSRKIRGEIIFVVYIIGAVFIEMAQMASSKLLPRVGGAISRNGTSLTRAAPCIQQMQKRRATVVPPVTQDATGSKGPTAMVFMNMGGPSTTAEVGSFLSRLFV